MQARLIIKTAHRESAQMQDSEPWQRGNVLEGLCMAACPTFGALVSGRLESREGQNTSSRP